MGFAKRIVSCLSAFSVVLCIFCLSCVTAFADSSVKAVVGSATLSITVPTGFDTVTADDLDKSADYFKDLPITKNEAIKRVDSGILINSFSTDKKREIRYSAFASNELGKYSATETGKANAVTNKNNLIESINNFSALSAADREKVTEAISDELKSQGHTFLSAPSEIKISGYYFIKMYARIGSSTAGYTYTSVMTIIGGKCYELTCYDNSPVLEQAQIDDNEKVISSLKLTIKGDNGEIASNNFQSIIAFAAILASVAVISGVIISFIKPFIAQRNADEQIKPQKRK